MLRFSNDMTAFANYSEYLEMDEPGSLHVFQNAVDPETTEDHVLMRTDSPCRHLEKVHAVTQSPRHYGENSIFPADAQSRSTDSITIVGMALQHLLHAVASRVNVKAFTETAPSLSEVTVTIGNDDTRDHREVTEPDDREPWTTGHCHVLSQLTRAKSHIAEKTLENLRTPGLYLLRSNRLNERRICLHPLRNLNTLE